MTKPLVLSCQDASGVTACSLICPSAAFQQWTLRKACSIICRLLLPRRLVDRKENASCCHWTSAFLQSIEAPEWLAKTHSPHYTCLLSTLLTRCSVRSLGSDSTRHASGLLACTQKTALSKSPESSSETPRRITNCRHLPGGMDLYPHAPLGEQTMPVGETAFRFVGSPIRSFSSVHDMSARFPSSISSSPDLAYSREAR